MTVEYDKPIEITKEQYALFTKEQFSGAVAHRQESGKFFIKVWIMEYAEIIEQILNQGNV